MGQIEKDTPFNMAMLFYLRLSRLMEEKDKCAIYGNIPGWYNCLRAIYRNIFFKVSLKDREDLNKKFSEARKYINIPNGHSVIKQAQKMGMNEAAQILDEIDSDIMIILDKRNMIFPRIEITGGLENIRKRYGLNETN